MKGSNMTPDEVTEKKKRLIPSEVIEAFNDTIATHWDGSQSRFELSKVKTLVANKRNDTKSEGWWYDIEDIYIENLVGK